MKLYFMLVILYQNLIKKNCNFADKLNRRRCLQHHTFINILVTRMITFVKAKKSVDQTNSGYKYCKLNIISINLTKNHQST